MSDEQREPTPHNYMPELIMAICGINPICGTCHEVLGLCKCPPEQLTNESAATEPSASYINQ